MALSRSPASEYGYATPGALVLSLAFAMIGSATLARSVQLLALCRAEFSRAQEEMVMEGAQLAAAAAVIRSGRQGPYRWALASEVGWIDVVAESETEKLSFLAASRLEDADFLELGVDDAEQLRGRLAEAAVLDEAPQVESLDDAPLWRACASRFVSLAGVNNEFIHVPAQEPGPGPHPPSWRVGQAWRIQVTTPAGWRDDRIVRFTGDAQHPAAVASRHVRRGQEGGAECDTVLAAVFGA